MLTNRAETSISTGYSVGVAPQNGFVDSVGRCPCCGGTMRMKHPVVDLESNTIVWGADAKVVTSKQAEIALILSNHMPRPARHEQIIHQLYGHQAGEAEDPLNTLKVHISKLRKTLPAGVTIRNIHSVGYVMEAV